MTPKISIGIPTYNRANLLTQAVQSVLLQTYQDFEIVISDDRSTDNTAEVVAGFNDKRIKYHRTATNLRPPRNWNNCVRLSEGEFFALLPDDDVYCPNFLAEMVAELQAHPDIGSVQCGFYSVNESLRPFRTNLAHNSTLCLQGERALIWQVKNLNCIPGAIMFRRTRMLEMGLWREDYWDDWAFIVKMAYRHGFAFIPKLLSANRVHQQNLNRTLTGEKRDMILDLINQYTDIFGEALPATPSLIKFHTRCNRLLGQHCILLTLSAIRRGNWSEASFHFTRAHQLYALAGLDPGFIKLRLSLYLEKRRQRQQQQVALQAEPILHFDAYL